MKRFLVGVKKFFSNKNTVTIVCVLGAILVLYFGYNYRIDQITSPIKVPYAKVKIQPRTEITQDMVGYVEIPRNMLTNNTITDINQVIGYYANYNTEIPMGSVFYKSTLVTWDQMPDSAWADIPDGYTVVSLPVTTETTYGNSIFPGKLLLGKLIESIEVLAVKDSSGNHVFENSSELKSPSSLIFAVPEELHLLLRKASYLSGEIIPVPRNKDYSQHPGETVVSSEYIEDFILSQTVVIPDQELPSLDDNLE